MYSVDEKKVVLIKTNLIDLDPRLFKEIDTLKKGGYSVILLCWDRDCKTSINQEKIGDNYEEIRFRLKAPYGIKILPFLPLWLCFEFYWLLKLKSDLMHAINFDTIIPAVIVGKIKKKPVIYEMFDTYEDEVVLPRIIRNLLIYIDKIFMWTAIAVIIVDEARLKEFNGIPNSNIVTIYNSPPDLINKIKIPSEKQSNKEFTIFFAGALYDARNPNLNQIIEAVKNLKRCKLIIAGYGDLVEEIKHLANEIPDKVQFIGQISYSEVLKRSLAADLLVALYDPITLNIKYTSANKLFEAMMCQKPIIVSKGTGTADIVNTMKCGLIVDCNNIKEIKSAVLNLMESPDLCFQLGANGRDAYEKMFNWHIMEQRILTLYNKVCFEN